MADLPRLAQVYEAASLYAARFGLPRLHILSADGRPVLTFEHRYGIPVLAEASWKEGEPAANVPFLLFWREHSTKRPRPMWWRRSSR